MKHTDQSIKDERDKVRRCVYRLFGKGRKPVDALRPSFFLALLVRWLERRMIRRRLLHDFDTVSGQLLLEWLEHHFETDLPVFQGQSGKYDPLDAMRRDAYREVFLFLRREVALGKQIKQENEY